MNLAIINFTLKDGILKIPILAEHIGGANSLNNEICVITCGKAVITTATDVNGKFAVDTFATKKNLHIGDINIVKKYQVQS